MKKFDVDHYEKNTTTTVFGQNNYTNKRRFWTIFHHKTRVFTVSKKYKKLQFRVQWLKGCDKAYLTKATRRATSLQNFKHVQNKKYNLDI